MLIPACVIHPFVVAPDLLPALAAQGADDPTF